VWYLVPVPVGPKSLSFATPSLLSDLDGKQRRPIHRVTFYMAHVGASKKFPNDAPWEMLNQKIQLANFSKSLALVRMQKKKPVENHGISTRTALDRNSDTRRINSAIGSNDFKITKHSLQLKGIGNTLGVCDKQRPLRKHDMQVIRAMVFLHFKSEKIRLHQGLACYFSEFN